MLVVAALWFAAWATGVTGRFTLAGVSGIVAGGGAWGVLAFTVVFAAGQLLRIPSTVFVAAAVAVYGRNFGMLVAVVGALVSATVSFAVVRAFAGQALADVQNPLIRRVLRTIKSRPVRTVALLRVIFQTAPPLNYALPMTTIRWRDHLVGSALGLPAPVAGMALFFDWLWQHVV